MQQQAPTPAAFGSSSYSRNLAMIVDLSIYPIPPYIISHLNNGSNILAPRLMTGWIDDYQPEIYQIVRTFEARIFPSLLITGTP
jgi:hypothetical protein